MNSETVTTSLPLRPLDVFWNSQFTIKTPLLWTSKYIFQAITWSYLTRTNQWRPLEPTETIWVDLGTGVNWDNRKEALAEDKEDQTIETFLVIQMQWILVPQYAKPPRKLKRRSIVTRAAATSVLDKDTLHATVQTRKRMPGPPRPRMTMPYPRLLLLHLTPPTIWLVALILPIMPSNYPPKKERPL